MKKDKGILSLFLPFALLICNKFAFPVANTLRLWYNNLNTQRVKFALMLTFFMFTTQVESPNKSALINLIVLPVISSVQMRNVKVLAQG